MKHHVDSNMTPEYSLVSVVIPCFNAALYLPNAVASVVSQSHSQWELILVNDGSTDDTAAFLDSIQSNSIRVIHQANRGVSAARNAGLEIATGRYITFLDADDELTPGSLEVRVRLLEGHPEIDVADGAVSVRDRTMQTEVRRYTPYYRGPLLPRLLKLDSRVFFSVCYMFRRNTLGGVRFPEHMTHAEDLSFFMLLAHQNGLAYGHVEEVVYNYRSGGASAMSNMDGLEKGYLDLLELIDERGIAAGYTRQLLKCRIAKILFLSWRAKGQTSHGLGSALNALMR
jgi:glycosyltransferase involved in cell wall biosynthesis